MFELQSGVLIFKRLAGALFALSHSSRRHLASTHRDKRDELGPKLIDSSSMFTGSMGQPSHSLLVAACSHRLFALKLALDVFNFKLLEALNFELQNARSVPGGLTSSGYAFGDVLNLIDQIKLPFHLGSRWNEQIFAICRVIAIVV